MSDRSVEQHQQLISSHPGMTSWDERWALHETARTQLTGLGDIVDLGCWLGSLTMSLALGFEGNPRASSKARRVQSFDSFVWQANYMDAEWPEWLPLPRPNDGETFLPAFDHLMQPVRHQIDVHSGDLAHASWGNEPIELLSVDAMKSTDVARSIIATFYPALIPESGYLFHQDFCHGYTWWIHLYHFLLRDHFAAVDLLEGSGGVLFRLVRPLSRDAIARALSADLSDPALAAGAFAFSIQQVAAADRGAVAAAYARCESVHGRSDTVRRIIDQYGDDPVMVREVDGLGGLL